MDEYPDGIYDQPDPVGRNRLTAEELEALPLVDDHNEPIQIYSTDGDNIQRRLGLFDRNVRPHGILMKSGQLQSLFTCDNADDEDETALGTSVVPFTFYPQAGLRSVGHFQAKGLMGNCYPLLARINRSLNVNRVNNGDEEHQDGHHDHAPYRKIVYGISSQGYNAVTHSTRGRTAQHHDAQVGLVTGALAGAWATGNSEKRKAGELVRRCSRKMPHQSFADKIRNPEISRDLRLENVYCIDIGGLREDDQTGG